ncbi:MAG: type II toxin-antitoxin system YoeB family toxin [Propionibacteriaceae bacterium]|nr:type II toxin-antitoxin system YoeB family toxin [Propionibacteriaceae bacterium]
METVSIKGKRGGRSVDLLGGDPRIVHHGENLGDVLHPLLVRLGNAGGKGRELPGHGYRNRRLPQHDAELIGQISADGNARQIRQLGKVGGVELVDPVDDWSRRITGEHRLVYRIEDGEIVILAARFHYEK